MASQVPYYELYRNSSIGAALTDALDELIKDAKIQPQLALKVLENFDRSIAEALSDKVRARLTFKGHLDTYRFCDEVWIFILKDVVFKTDNNESLTADKIRIVACNSKKSGEP